MKEQIKKHYKFILGIVVGLILSSIVTFAANAVASKDIAYDNSKSGLTSINLQGAIDELNEKAKNAEAKCPHGYKCIKNNIAVAYTYNQTSGASNYCVTGEESTCVETTCYENQSSGSCPAGTILKYKVNDSDIVTFHVMFDEGNTIAMQSQKNIIDYSPWWYLIDSTTYYPSDNSKGPLYILPVLESATSGWTNVNNQTYTMGTTVFKTNAYTGCSSYNSCTTNTYTLEQRTGKARMITMQEAAALGCSESEKSCPIWLYNYSYGSTDYGGTENSDINRGYWTMSAKPSTSEAAQISFAGRLDYDDVKTTSLYGARAVVVISK